MLRLGLGSRGCDPYFEKQPRVESQSHTDLRSPSLLGTLEGPSPVFTPAPRSQDAQSLAGGGGVSGFWSRPLECCPSLHLTSLSAPLRLPSLCILWVCKCVSAKFCRDNPSKPFNADTISFSFSFPGSWKWELVALSQGCIGNLESVFCFHHCPESYLKNPLAAAAFWPTRCGYHVPSLPFKGTACLKARDQNIKASTEIWYVLHSFTH